MKIAQRITAALVMAAVLLAAGGLATAAGPRVMVWAAASTTNALQEVNRAFRAASGIEVVTSFAASSTLARQIERGAPADVFVSANTLWMDYLEKRGLLAPGTRRRVARNRLVLIAPGAGPAAAVVIGRGSDLAGKLGRGRLAMGDPAHVPAGIYGKQALVSLGLWSSLARRVAAAPTVRAALAWVQRGEAPLGIVYATDAAISRKVHVVGTFPPWAHAPIIYPAAIIAGRDHPAARAYLEFLGSRPAAAIWAAHGFAAP